MNIFDLVFLVVIGAFLIRGFIKGFFIEVASLLALIVGIWGSIRFSGLVGNYLITSFDLETPYLGLIAFAVTFVGIVIAIHLVARIADKLFSAVALGWLVKILGAVFGVLKALIIISIVLVFLNTVNERVEFLPPDKKNDSMLYKPLSMLAPAVFPLIVSGDLIKTFEGMKKKKEETSFQTDLLSLRPK